MTTTKGNILVVEDDLNLGYLIMEILQNDGYTVRLARDGNAGLVYLKRQGFDLCIFDVMMPYMDGFNLAKQLKHLHPNTPFLFLTARVLKEDRIKGYNIGAEDYINKPFDEEELLCKINVIMRRKGLAQEVEELPSFFNIGDYTFDVERMELCYFQESIRMTEKESKVLQQLCLHKNRILRRDDAVEKIYGKKDYFLGRSFDVFISKIRKLLARDESISIDNVYKVGFILNVKDKVPAVKLGS
ncbi:response regulator transcription factor [Saprospiraceae bacterium]|nr:response regulator transcription factor [Saprospiraceae bacterium]